MDGAARCAPASQLKRLQQCSLPHFACQVRTIESSGDCQSADAQTAHDQGVLTIGMVPALEVLLEQLDHTGKDSLKHAFDWVVVGRSCVWQ